MNIAYCDNELHFLEEFLNKFSDIFANDTLKLYSTPEELLRLQIMPDIIFMDIEFNREENGLDYAEKIFAASPNTRIIFITAYTEKFVQDIFLKKVNVKGILSKPVQRTYLQHILDKVRNDVVSENSRKILLETKNSTEAVKESAVLYAESSRHCCIVHTDDEDYTVRCKLSELAEKLPSSFAVCHKSYIVNMNRIAAFRRTSVELDSGKVLPVSRSRAAEFKDIYFNHIGKFE